MSMPNVNFFDAEKSELSPEEKQLVARRAQALGPAYRLSYQHPLHIVKGDGVWLYDSQGNKYLDAYNNVPCVGHCHPEVTAALAQQASTLNVHTRYLHEGILNYAEALLETLPLDHMMFTASGSEANDLACRFAESYTGGTGFIATEMAYHGGTKLVAELSPSLGGFAKEANHVRLVRAPDTYRHKDVGAFFAAQVKAAVDDFRKNGIKPAALIVDTIFASDGVFADPKGFLAPAVDEIRKAGGIFIADEVQAGFGRTGEAFWGFARHGLKPDIVTMGKPMGAGYPMAGLAVRHDIVEGFGEKSRYFNTFGGTPVAAAVGMTVLEIIRRDQLMQNADAVGAYLRGGLRAIGHALIADVRGAGLYIAVDLMDGDKPAAEATTKIVNALREKRILISSSGIESNMLKIRPPLVFSRVHADMVISALADIFRTI